MSEFLIDHHGSQVWYDLTSYRYQTDIFYQVIIDGLIFYIRPHREDGPAIIEPDGSEYYYVKGNYHRDDGPSVVLVNNVFLSWWLNGEPYSFDGWCEKSNKSKEEINFLKLKWGSEWT